MHATYCTSKDTGLNFWFESMFVYVHAGNNHSTQCFAPAVKR